MQAQLIIVYFDGGSKPTWFDNAEYPRGYGSYQIDGGADLQHKSLKQNFGVPCTNNQAEYLALIQALKWLRHHVEPEKASLDIWSDSQLVVNQVQHRWRTKVDHLKELRDETNRLLKPYGRWMIHWYERRNNVNRFGH